MGRVTGVPSASLVHRVLVVEDHADSAELLQTFLRSFGHRVEVAEDAGSAIAIARDLRPSVILLDVGLPIVDGIELARMLRTDLGPDVRMIAVTANGDPETRKRARDATITHFLLKPVQLDEVAAALTSWA